MTIKIHEKNDKRALKNKLYKALKPINGKYYSDENWQAITDFKNIVKPLLPENLDLEVFCFDGGYRKSRDGLSQWKEYFFQIYDKAASKDVLTGQINCAAAGSVEDPFSRYDVTITMY
ncbi:MAG: hypothetical protein IK038_02780 [Bacteroidaceae bacterium]|nr:hypothetical protein [Bacteroidaceae bacterium]